MLLVLAIIMAVSLSVRIIVLIWRRQSCSNETYEQNPESGCLHITHLCCYPKPKSESIYGIVGIVQVTTDSYSDDNNDMELDGPTLSKCDKCTSGYECNFSLQEYSNPLASLVREREDLYDIISSIFHISSDAKQKIENNSSSTMIRCLDVLHRVYHRGDELNMDKVRETVDEYADL